MKILVCGVGAIGSNLVANLVPDLKGEHEITVLDKDLVEERNVTAGTQFYTPDQVGLLKVEALQFNVYKWYQREIKIINQEFRGTIAANWPQYSLIIDCFDNHEARHLIQNFYIDDNGLDIPTNLLHIGFSADYTFAIEWAENYTVPSDILKGIDICEMPGASAFVATVASLGALVAEEFILKGKKLDILGGKFIHSLAK